MIVRRAGGAREVSADELRSGDPVLVNPGALVPVDGVVINGHSFVDQARISAALGRVSEVAPSLA